MKINPYKTLNVPKDATAAEIKKAYKKKAKEKHPDTGGNKDDFSALSTAYGLLSSPEKRAYFDEFGEEQPVDNILNQAIGIINTMIDEMFKQCDENNIAQFDIIKHMIDMVNAGLNEIQHHVVMQQNIIIKLDAIEKVFNKRLKHKKSATSINFFTLTAANKRNATNKNISDLETKQTIHKKVIELLSDFEFNVEHAPSINWGHLGNIFNATTTGAA